MRDAEQVYAQQTVGEHVVLVIEVVLGVEVRVDVPVHVVDIFFIVCFRCPNNAVDEFYNLLRTLLAVILDVNRRAALLYQGGHSLEHVQLHAFDIYLDESWTGR